MSPRLARMAKALEWASRVAAWKASGLSRRDFARDGGYAPATLGWWQTELRRRGIAAVEAPAPGPMFTRVVARHTPSAPPIRSTSVIIDIGRARITVARGFDAALLRDVVAALETR